MQVRGCSRDLASLLSNGPDRAYHGSYGGVQGILTGLTKSTDNPSSSMVRKEAISLPLWPKWNSFSSITEQFDWAGSA